MRCLITGGCGFIGSNLTHALSKRGWSVDVVDDLSSGHLELLEGLNMRVVLADLLPRFKSSQNRENFDVLVIQGDFAHSNVLDEVRLKTYDVIFHLAANPRVEYSVQNPVATTENNVLKTVALFTAAIDSVNRIVFSSSCAVYGDPWSLPVAENIGKNPKSPYALQKLICEKYAQLYSSLYGLDIACLRYFNVYGPGQHGSSAYATAISAWCNAIYNNQPLRSDGDGEQTRDLVYVDDIVRANILVAESKEKFLGDSYNVCTGVQCSNNEILEIFKEKFSQAIVAHAPKRKGDIRHIYGDAKNIKSKVSWQPTINLNVGLSRTFTWWGIE